MGRLVEAFENLTLLSPPGEIDILSPDSLALKIYLKEVDKLTTRVSHALGGMMEENRGTFD
jgi:hypothetical protein